MLELKQIQNLVADHVAKVHALKHYTPADVARDLLNEPNERAVLNPAVPHTIDIRTLPRFQQPFPATPVRKLPQIIKHFIRNGIY